MPISGPASYLPAIEEFLSHWDETNTALGAAGEMILPGGVERGTLGDFRDELEDMRDGVSDNGVDRSLARADLNAKIAALQARMVEFNARIRGDLSGNPIVAALVPAFAVGEGEALVRDGLRKVARLWTKVNALTPTPSGMTLPMKLADDYTLALFNTDRNVLRDAYRTLSDTEVELAVSRAARNKVQEVIYPILKEYRQKVLGMERQFPQLVATLPALTPPEGHTPAAVQAQAEWDATASAARITWTESEDADLKEYQVRGVSGDDYEPDDEAVLVTVPAAGARELETVFGLGSPGLTAGFKVYVVLNTGNERGSDAVFVTRPG